MQHLTGSEHPSRTVDGKMRMRELATGRVFDHPNPADSGRLVDVGTHEYVHHDTPLWVRLRELATGRVFDVPPEESAALVAGRGPQQQPTHVVVDSSTPLRESRA